MLEATLRWRCEFFGDVDRCGREAVGTFDLAALRTEMAGGKMHVSAGSPAHLGRAVVWCGVVWCGVVWCVWCAVVWCGVVWCAGVVHVDSFVCVRACVCVLCWQVGIATATRSVRAWLTST